MDTYSLRRHRSIRHRPIRHSGLIRAALDARRCSHRNWANRCWSAGLGYRRFYRQPLRCVNWCPLHNVSHGWRARHPCLGQNSQCLIAAQRQIWLYHRAARLNLARQDARVAMAVNGMKGWLTGNALQRWLTSHTRWHRWWNHRSWRRCFIASIHSRPLHDRWHRCDRRR